MVEIRNRRIPNKQLVHFRVDGGKGRPIVVLFVNVFGDFVLFVFAEVGVVGMGIDGGKGGLGREEGGLEREFEGWCDAGEEEKQDGDACAASDVVVADEGEDFVLVLFPLGFGWGWG